MDADCGEDQRHLFYSQKWWGKQLKCANSKNLWFLRRWHWILFLSSFFLSFFLSFFPSFSLSFFLSLFLYFSWMKILVSNPTTIVSHCLSLFLQILHLHFLWLSSFLFLFFSRPPYFNFFSFSILLQISSHQHFIVLLYFSSGTRGGIDEWDVLTKIHTIDLHVDMKDGILLQLWAVI